MATRRNMDAGAGMETDDGALRAAAEAAGVDSCSTDAYIELEVNGEAASVNGEAAGVDCGPADASIERDADGEGAGELSEADEATSDSNAAPEDDGALWVRQWDAQTGAFFYFNPRTQQATWERPAGYIDTMAPDDDDEELEMEASDGGGINEEKAQKEAMQGDGGLQTELTGAAVKIQSVYRGHGARKQRRQRQWLELFDPSTGKLYYYNKSTGETQWKRPKDFVEGVRDTKTEGVVKIQSAFRGKQVREQVKQLSIAVLNANEDAFASLGDDQFNQEAAPDDTLRLEAAATVIQCAVRKHKASKRMEMRKERLRTLTDVGVMDQKARELRQAIDELQAEVDARSLSGPDEEEQFPHLVGLVSAWNSSITTMKDHFLALSGQIALISGADTVPARIECAEQSHKAIASVRSECVALLRSVLLMNSYFVELDVYRVNAACAVYANLKKNELCALSDSRMRKIVQIDDLYDIFEQAESALRRAMGLTDFSICTTTSTGKKFEEFHPQVVDTLTHMRELELRMAHKVELLHIYRNRQQARDEITLMEREEEIASQFERSLRQQLTDQKERAQFLQKCRESWQKGIVQRSNDLRYRQKQEESRRHEDIQHRARMEKMKLHEQEQRKKAKLSIWEAVKEGRPVDTIQSMVLAEIQKARRHGYEFSVVGARSERGETLLQIACWWGHESLVSFLISEGADINVVDSRANKFSLLHDAARRGHLRIIRVLLEHGLPLDIRDSWGDTPLHWACRRNHYDAVVLLLGGHLHPLSEQITAEITRVLRAKNIRGKSPYNITKSETIRRILKAAETGDFPRIRPGCGSASNSNQYMDIFGRRKTIPGLQELREGDMKRFLHKSKTSANFRLKQDDDHWSDNI